MCGIAGIISNENHAENLQRMLQRQHHRGPDHTGMWHDDNAYLGHNRLKIIDLSEDANQPFFSFNKEYAIVFNGEIYNYIEIKETLKNHFTFYTKSDTEVLLNAYIHWGSACLEKFRGMFAFAIYHIPSKKLFAARDRFGVKPFRYSQINNTFIFSSEIKAIHATGLVQKTHNTSLWASYFSYAQYSYKNETFWQDIYNLEPGHFLEYENNQITIQPYYNFISNVTNISFDSYETAFAKLENLLYENINFRLRSDVPRAFNLSGGIDSSLLFCLIKEQLPLDKTAAFTFYSNNENYDEIKWVEEIINTTKFPWHKCLIDPIKIPEQASYLQKIQDEPYSGIATLAYSQLFANARQQGYIVVLDGSGMDEQMVGYDYYLNGNNSLVQGMKSSPTKVVCLNEEFAKLAIKEIHPKPFNNDVQNLQYRDIFYTKLQRDLRMTDLCSMAFSTEMREPFIDHKLVEYSFSLPLEYKVKNNQRKYIIREILRKKTKGNFVEAAKRPIQTPQREWLSGELKNWAQDLIYTGMKKYNYLNQEKVEEELNRFFNGNNENSFYIWQWLTLGLME